MVVRRYIGMCFILWGTCGHGRADLVAYWPLNDGAPGTPVSATGADDVIDDPNHGAEDAVAHGAGNDTWELDPERGVVLSTTEEVGCGQDSGYRPCEGFSWSLWVKVARSNNTDTGADVIMGSRNGVEQTPTLRPAALGDHYRV